MNRGKIHVKFESILIKEDLCSFPTYEAIIEYLQIMKIMTFGQKCRLTFILVRLLTKKLFI